MGEIKVATQECDLVNLLAYRRLQFQVGTNKTSSIDKKVKVT